VQLIIWKFWSTTHSTHSARHAPPLSDRTSAPERLTAVSAPWHCPCWKISSHPPRQWPWYSEAENSCCRSLTATRRSSPWATPAWLLFLRYTFITRRLTMNENSYY